MMRRLFKIYAPLALLLAAAVAWGQVVVPGSVQPGQIERQFQPPPEPRAKPAEIVIPATQQAAPVNAQEIRFLLNQLTVDGVTVYPAGSISAVYAGLLGREVSLGEIYRVAETLTTRYRNDGYILSQVIVPAQNVDGGVVRLHAIEGYVANVRMEGGSDALRVRLSAHAERIKASRPLMAATLERYLLLINDQPGVFARAILTPAKTGHGASELVLQLSERTNAAGLSIDNRGSRALGPYRLTGDMDFNGLTGASRTGLRFVTSGGDRELNMLSFSHDQYLGTEGGKLSLMASMVRSRPEELTIIPLNLETSSNTVSLAYSFPVIRSRTENLSLRGAFSAHNGRSDIFGVANSRDRLRALRLGVTYDRADALGGVNIADAELSQGLRAMGASANGDPMLSRASGRVDFSKITIYAARLQSLAQNWSLLAAFNGQYAFSNLLSSELFSFGGEQFGRGYDPSELTGDHGAVLSSVRLN